MPVLFTLYWSQPGARGSLQPDLPVGMAWDTLTSAQRSWVIALAALPFAAAVHAVWRLRALLGCYATGDVFGADAIRHVALAGRAWLLWVAVRFAAEPVQSVVLTWDNGPGARMLTVAVDGDALIAAVLGTLLIVIAWVMQAGRRAVVENRQFV